MSDSVFVGIDVSSEMLEVASTAQSGAWQVGNDTAGIEQLASRLGEFKPALVVLEATGGYEFEAACALQGADAAVAVVNPRTARDFAGAMGALAKTDALDVRMLAAFARVLHQHPERERFVKPMADTEPLRLQALVLRRRQLVQMITAERQRQRMRISHAAARPSMERVIEFLKAELGDSDTEVAAHVGRHYAQLAAALASMPWPCSWACVTAPCSRPTTNAAWLLASARRSRSSPACGSCSPRSMPWQKKGRSGIPRLITFDFQDGCSEA